jgi:hypothetical protein
MNSVNAPLVIICYVLLIAACTSSTEKTSNKNIHKDESLQSLKNSKKVIPFIYNDNTISFNVKINDSIAGEFLFDSGLTTDYNLFSKPFSDLHGFSKMPVKYSTFQGIGNIHKLPVYTNVFDVHLAWANSKKHFGVKQLGPYDERYDGLFNIDLFRDSIVAFDYKNKQIQFHKAFNDTGYVAVNIIQRGTVRMLELAVNISKNKKIKGLFQIDTGYSGGFLFLYANGNLFNELMRSTKSKKILGVTNFDKPINVFSNEIESVSIDDLVVFNPTINFSKIELPNEAKGIFLGLIGNKFLDRFHCVFDFKRNILYLKQIKVMADVPEYPLGITIYSSRSEKKKIKTILENSSSYNAGLLPGDEISKINGINIATYSKTGVDSLLTQLEKANKQIKVEGFRKDKYFSFNVNTNKI